MRFAGPLRYVGHLTDLGYHPRSNKHGDFLSKCVVRDLLDSSDELRSAAIAGKLVYELNYDVQVNDENRVTDDDREILKDLAWNIDLAIGPPADAFKSGKAASHSSDFLPEAMIRRAAPKEPWLVLDAKGIMTEHGKARRNRQRDLTALYSVMHTFYPTTVVGAALAINIAGKFRSPLRKSVSVHIDIRRIVAETLALFRAIRRAGADGREPGIEGLGCFVVDYANTKRSPAKLVQAAPAPTTGDRINYDEMVINLRDALLARYRNRL